MLELLLSQERVVSLVYAKTFPVNTRPTNGLTLEGGGGQNSSSNLFGVGSTGLLDGIGGQPHTDGSSMEMEGNHHNGYSNAVSGFAGGNSVGGHSIHSGRPSTANAIVMGSGNNGSLVSNGGTDKLPALVNNDH